MEWNRTDDEKRLSVPPLGRQGFSDRLRQSILDRLDEPERKASSRTTVFGLAAGLTLVVALLAVPFTGLLPIGPFDTDKRDGDAPASSGSEAISESRPESVPSGLLIGFRRDAGSVAGGAQPGQTDYRTIWLVKERDGIRQEAQVGAIVAPYDMEFWTLFPTTESVDGAVVRTIAAQPATAKRASASGTAPAGAVRYSERLDFVRNRFATLTVTEERKEKGGARRTETVRVSEFPRLQQRPRAALDENAGRYVTPAEARAKVLTSAAGAVSGTGGTPTASDSVPSALASLPDGLAKSLEWAIVRNSGRWVARFAEPASDKTATDTYRWLPQEIELPEAIVSHDRLCCSWNDIRSLQPAAVDALSAPGNDWLVVLTAEKLHVYEVTGGVPERTPELEVALAPGENLIMGQWATADYVRKWTDAVRKLAPEFPAAETAPTKGTNVK